MSALAVHRRDADHNYVRKGSLQHEVLEGQQATSYVDGDELAMTVSCREIGLRHREPSLYGLAVSLEVPVETRLPIHSEVATRIRQRVLARTRV